MKLRNLGITAIISVLAILSFSSCTSDRKYHWEQATINSVVEVMSDSRGYFDGTYDIDVRSDIYDLSGKPIGRYVSDIEYRGGDIVIKSDYAMRSLLLEVYIDGEVYSSIELLNIRGGNVDNIFDGQGVVNFLGDASDVLRSDGYAEIGYNGVSAIDGKSYMDIDIEMRIDAYVRD